MADFNKLIDFINDKSFADYAEVDKLGLDSRFNSFIKAGSVYSVKSELSKIQGVVKSSLGFDDVTITSDKGVANIMFHHKGDPDGTKAGSFSFSLGKSADGMVYLNGMPQTNMATYTQINGKGALVSSTTMALKSVGDALRQYSSSWQKLDSKTVAKKAQSTINIAIRDQLKNNVSLDNSSKKDMAEMFDSSKFSALTPESKEVYKQRIIVGNFLTKFYNDTVKKASSYSKRGIKPSNESEYRRQVENIMAAAFGGAKGQSLEKIIKQNDAWMYDQVWNQGLSEFVDFLSKSGVVQGGIGFGNYDVIATSKRSLPMINAVSSDKISKAGRFLKENQKQIGKSTAKIGTTNIWTKTAYDAYAKAAGGKNNFQKNTLYGFSEISEDVIIRVRKQIQNELKKVTSESEKKKLEKQYKETLIGLGKDASLMTDTLAKDFKGISEKKEYFTNGDVLELNFLHTKIKEKIEKNLKNDKKGGFSSLSDEDKEKAINKEFSSILEAHKDPKTAFGKKDRYDSYIRTILKDYLGLDKNERIGGKNTGYTLTDRGITNVTTFQKRAYNSFTTRSNTSDFRSVITAISEGLMARYLREMGFTDKEIYKDPNNKNGGLNINALSQKEELNGKNVRDRTYGTLEYAISHATNAGKSGDEIQEALNKAGWKGIIDYKSDKGTFFFNNEAFDRKFLHKKKSGKGFDLADSLISASEFAKNIGAYDPEKTYYERIGGKLVQLANAPIARELHMSQASDYEGFGKQTQSKFTVTNQTVQTARGNIGDMARLYDGKGSKLFSQKEIEEMGKWADYQENLLKEGKKKLATHQQTLRTSNELWKNHGKDYSRLGVATLTAEDLKDVDTELKYINDNEASGLRKNGVTLEERLSEIREKYYNAHRKELDELYAGQTPEAIKEQIEVIADLGSQVLYDPNSNRVTSRLSLFHGKQIGSPDPNKYSLDEAATANMRIAGIVKDMAKPLSGSENSANKSKTYGQKYVEIVNEVADSIRSGGIYDSLTRASMGEDTGWFKLTALAEGSEDVFKYILQQKGIDPSDASKIPSMIMNASNAREALRSIWGSSKEGRSSLNELRDKLEKQSPAKHQIKDRTGKYKDAKDVSTVDYLIDRFTLESENYAGGGLTSQYLRHPVIKGYSDIMGGAVALTNNSKIAEEGTLRLSRAQADIQKGDMDGDKVAMKIAILNGDQDAFNSAYSSYTKHYAQAHQRYLQAKNDKSAQDDQKVLEKINKLREKAGEEPLKSLENYGDISGINSPTDSKKNSILGIAQGIGQKGAGIYGDEVKASLNIAEKFGVGGEGIGTNSENAVFADLATNIFHTLYQEGINIKNAKVEGMLGATTEQIATNVLDLSGKASTWNDSQQMENFLKEAVMLGAGKDKAFFSEKQMADMHLDNFEALGEAGANVANSWYDLLSEALKNAETAYGKTDKRTKLLKADVKQLKDIKDKQAKGLKSLSYLAISTLVTSDQFKEIFRDADNKTFGDYIEGRYREAGIIRPDRILNNKSGQLDASSLETEAFKSLDDDLQKMIKKGVYSNTGSVGEANPFFQRGKLRTEGRVLSPTGAVKTALPSIYSQVSSNLLPYLLPRGEYDEDSVKELMKNAVSDESDWTSIKTILKGNIAHKAAEVYANAIKDGLDLNSEDKEERKKAQEELRSRTSDVILSEVVTPGMAAAITSGIFSEKDPNNKITRRKVGLKELTDFIDKQTERGFKNYKFIQDRADEGEEFLGAEVGIPMLYRQGKDGVARGRGVIDYLSKTSDSLKVYDYKNYASGTPSAENVLQLLDYANTLGLTRDMIKQEGFAQDFISFLGTGIGDKGNLLAQSWQERLYDLAIDQLRAGKTEEEWKNDPLYSQLYGSNGKRSTDFEKILRNTPQYVKTREEQSRIFDALKSDSAENIGAYIVSTNDLGITSKYKINTTSDAAKEVSQKYLDAVAEGKPMSDEGFQKELEEFIKKNPTIVTREGPSVFTGDEEDYKKLYSSEIQSIVKLGQEKSKLEFKKEELAVAKELNETETTEKQKSLDYFEEQTAAIEKQIQEKEALIKATIDGMKEFTVDGETYTFKNEDGSALTLSKEDLGAFTDFATQEELYSRKNNLAMGQSAAYNRQYKENTREEKRYNEELANLKAQQRLSKEKTLKLSDTEDKILDDEIKDIENYLGIIQSKKEKLATKINKEVQDKYKSSSTEEKKRREDELYIKQSLQIRGENEKMFSVGQSTQQKVFNLQRQIEEYDKSLVYKGTSNPEKAIIEKLRKKAVQELGRAQDDLKLYDDLYGQGGVKPSSDYLEGKSTAVDAKEVQKLQDQQVKDQKFTSDTGFLGIDAPAMNWFQKILTGGGIYTLLAKFKKGLNEIIQKAIQLDSAMTNLRIVTGESASDTRTLIDKYSDLAKELGTTTVEVASAASEWLRQGYEVAEVNDLITASTYLSKLGMIDSATATKDLTNIKVTNILL